MPLTENENETVPLNYYYNAITNKYYDTLLDEIPESQYHLYDINQSKMNKMEDKTEGIMDGAGQIGGEGVLEESKNDEVIKISGEKVPNKEARRNEAISNIEEMGGNNITMMTPQTIMKNLLTLFVIQSYDNDDKKRKEYCKLLSNFFKDNDPSILRKNGSFYKFDSSFVVKQTTIFNGKKTSLFKSKTPMEAILLSITTKSNKEKGVSGYKRAVQYDINKFVLCINENCYRSAHPNSTPGQRQECTTCENFFNKNKGKHNYGMKISLIPVIKKKAASKKKAAAEDDNDDKDITLIKMEPAPIIRNYIKMCYNNYMPDYWASLSDNKLAKRLRGTMFDNKISSFKKDINKNLETLKKAFIFEFKDPETQKMVKINYSCELDYNYDYYPTDIYDLDHKDGDHFHNYMSNIISICKICHGIKTKLQNDKGIKSQNYFTGLLISNILSISNNKQSVYDYILKRIAARKGFLLKTIQVANNDKDIAGKEEIRNYYDYYNEDYMKTFIKDNVQVVIDLSFSGNKWSKDHLVEMLDFLMEDKDFPENQNILNGVDVDNLDSLKVAKLKEILLDQPVIDFIKADPDYVQKYFEIKES
jgi:hypothetical protein